jgi:hypothetical protein
MGTFSDSIRKMADEQKQNYRDVANATLLDMSRRVILRTPVDEGFARGGWLPSTGAPQSENRLNTDTSGQEAIAAAQAVIMNEAFGNVFYLTNNLPYIRTLEYGLYPNPPANGTGKTQGGYSTQAPQGMVRVTLLEVESIINAQIDDVFNEG